MHSRFEQKLEELDRGLAGLPYHERREMRVEAGQHLTALAAAHVEMGATEEEAIVAAMESFGDSRTVARGIRRESLRLRKRQRVDRASRIILPVLAGAGIAPLLAVFAGAPLMLENNDFGWFYPIAGALCGLGIASKRLRPLGWGSAAVFAACCLIRVALSLQEGVNWCTGRLVGPFQPGESIFRYALHSLFADGYIWTREATSLISLVPAMVIAVLLWLMRPQTRWKAIPFVALLFVIIRSYFQMAPLTGRSYLDPGALGSYLLWSTVPNWILGVITGAVLCAARSAVDTVIRHAGTLKTGNSSSVPAGRPHTA